MKGISDLFIDVNPQQAAELVRTLFDPLEYVAISSMRNSAVKGYRTLTQVLTASELVGQLMGPEGKDLLLSLCTYPDQMNTYFHISTVRPRVNDNLSQRVKEDDIARVKCLYVDLDVKPGCFSSQEEAMTFLGTVPIRPNVVVSTGSGGLHAYWTLSDGGVAAHVGRELLVRWWAYLSELAGDSHIDKLVDVTRMSRLPGTIRWPKDNEKPAAVNLIWAQRTDGTHSSEILDLTEVAMLALLEKRRATRKQDESIRENIEHIYSGEDGWKKLVAVGNAEDWVNDHVPWESILSPVGWHKLYEDYAGRVLWARPGAKNKSAAVDWPESPHVMSLLSTSLDTGLFDLLDAGITLTKWRVMLRLNFADDYEAAINWVLTQMKSRHGI